MCLKYFKQTKKQPRTEAFYYSNYKPKNTKTEEISTQSQIVFVCFDKQIIMLIKISLAKYILQLLAGATKVSFFVHSSFSLVFRFFFLFVSYSRPTVFDIQNNSLFAFFFICRLFAFFLFSLLFPSNIKKDPLSSH